MFFTNFVKFGFWCPLDTFGTFVFSVDMVDHVIFGFGRSTADITLVHCRTIHGNLTVLKNQRIVRQIDFLFLSTFFFPTLKSSK